MKSQYSGSLSQGRIVFTNHANSHWKVGGSVAGLVVVTIGVWASAGNDVEPPAPHDAVSTSQVTSTALPADVSADPFGARTWGSGSAVTATEPRAPKTP